MIAPVAVGLGKTMVKSPAVLVLSPPKSITAHALFEALLLKIIAPLAVIVAVPKVRSAKSHTAVVPEVVGVTDVTVFPPEV